jgi:hypothetical protein
VKIIPKTPKIGQIPIQPKITPSAPPLLEKDPKKPEYLKTIEKLKRELEQKDLAITEKDQQLQSKDREIYLLVGENKKLKTVNQQKDQQLAEYKEKLKEINKKNKSLLQNYTKLKNTDKNPSQNQVNNNQTPIESPKEKIISKICLNSTENLPNTLSEIKEPKNNSPATSEKGQTELQAQIQV